MKITPKQAEELFQEEVADNIGDDEITLEKIEESDFVSGGKYESCDCIFVN